MNLVLTIYRFSLLRSIHRKYGNHEKIIIVKKLKNAEIASVLILISVTHL